jgi:hypothetical protein
MILAEAPVPQLFQPSTWAHPRTKVAAMRLVTLVHLRRGIASNMLGVISAKARMLRLTNLDDPRRRCFCAALILFAVCTISVRVATRYCFSRSLSGSKITTVQKHSLSEPGHQRMTKSAATWLPPTIRSTLLEAPTSYPRVAPAGPPLPALAFEKSLYNRPPPSC